MTGGTTVTITLTIDQLREVVRQEVERALQLRPASVAYSLGTSGKMGVDVNLIHELLVNLFQGDGNYQYNASGAFDGCPLGGNGTFCMWLDDAVGVGPAAASIGKHWSSFTQVNDPITHTGKDDFYNNDFGAYLEDTWKFRPSLTLNLGVRYVLENQGK